MCTDCTAAPCNEESRTRRSAFPSVTPKPRSSGSATTVATRFASFPAATWSFSGRISSCQFFWITVIIISIRSARGLTPNIPLRSAGMKRRRATCPAGYNLDAPALARPAAVMRDRRDVTDRGDGEARGLQRAQCRFTSRARPRDLDFEGAHAVLHRLLRRIFGRDLRGERRRFARTLEAIAARRCPGDGVALRVGDRDHRIVERRVHVRDARSDVLALAAANASRCGFFAHAQPCCGAVRISPKPP